MNFQSEEMKLSKKELLSVVNHPDSEPPPPRKKKNTKTKTWDHFLCPSLINKALMLYGTQSKLRGLFTDLGVGFRG